MAGNESRVPRIRDSQGEVYPFLRGMVTHDLMQRGLSFDEAYATARAVRDHLLGRDEISMAELEDLLQQHVAETFGADRLSAPQPSDEGRAPIEVTYGGAERRPFSRGLLARSLAAAGIDFDRAYRRVAELEAELRSERVEVVASRDLVRRVGDLLDRREGEAAARRYRLVHRIHRLPRPLIVYIGGAGGTGKSTLALELAPLLRIYRVTAVDTIRQVMRMLFSPAILPALHRSSFDAARASEATAASLGGPGHPAPSAEQRILANFEEQATRVCVGVRGVVERALAENLNMVLEGVHLAPSLVPFADLEGAAIQVPLLLTTRDEEVHRQRFLARGFGGDRPPRRYFEHYAAIRTLQQHLLEQAESADVPLIDTTDSAKALHGALETLTGLLQRQLPELVGGSAPRSRGPCLLIAIDGLADRPVRALGGRTPLAAARTPHLDRLAREGCTGLADPVAQGTVPDTASGTLALFGQSPHALRRGPVEALGAGWSLKPADVALRGNFATVDEDGRLVDRRAGRIRGGAARLARALDRLHLDGAPLAEVEVRVAAATEHRLAVVLVGPGLSSAISGSDPGDGAALEPPLAPRALDPEDEAAVATAATLEVFETAARRVLAQHPLNEKRAGEGLAPVNAVITRGAGHFHALRPITGEGKPLRVACIAGDSTVLGVAAALSADCRRDRSMTANLDTDLGAKLDEAADALADHDLVVVHVKGADIAAHDQRPDLKVEFLEALDTELGRWLKRYGGEEGLGIAVASDHASLSEVGQHGADPVPVLLWGRDVEADEVTAYDEQSAAAGALGRFPLQNLLGRLLDLA